MEATAPSPRARRVPRIEERLEVLARRADDLALFLDEEGARGHALAASNLAREIRRLAAQLHLDGR